MSCIVIICVHINTEQLFTTILTSNSSYPTVYAPFHTNMIFVEMSTSIDCVHGCDDRTRTKEDKKSVNVILVRQLTDTQRTEIAGDF